MTADGGLRLTVLGCSGTHPGPERACSSYLVEAEGYRLLVDCGNGSLVNLQRVTPVVSIDAVLISHLHPDHFADLYGLYYALRFAPDGPHAVPVHAPPGAQAHLAQLLRGDPDDSFGRTCRFSDTVAGEELELGPFSVRCFQASHPIPTLAPRIAYGDRVVAYSADSGPAESLTACARDADLFVADCSWLERQRPLPDGVHMTAREAGRHAQAAGAGTLLVTHVFPANDPAESAAEAAEVFSGRVLVATDLQEIAL